MSEPVTDLDWWAATSYPNADEDWGPADGRHAYNEDAALTPIFHALTRGGWHNRQHELAPGAADPAPIPVQAPAAPTRRERSETGRHHRTREATPRW